MTRVALASPFRTSQDRIRPYLARVASLRQWEIEPRVIAGEGDSTDDTAGELRRVCNALELPLTLLTVNHGGPVFGSVEDPIRFKQLSLVQNALFDACEDTDDAFVYIEHDLIWKPWRIQRLVEEALDPERLFDIHAPAILADIVPTARKRFYDTWAFRHLDGRRFSQVETMPQEEPFEVSSVGSCFAMRREVAQQVRIVNDFSLVGWSEEARRLGFTLGCWPTIVVEHP